MAQLRQDPSLESGNSSLLPEGLEDAPRPDRWEMVVPIQGCCSSDQWFQPGAACVCHRAEQRFVAASGLQL